MKNKLLLAFFCLLCCRATAQITITVPSGADTAVCGGPLTLHAVNNGYASNPVSLSIDDGYSTLLPIGFSFEFYGNTYTDMVVSSNGFVTFDASNASGYSNWDITTGIPGNTYCENAVLGIYSDIYIPAGGTVNYGVAGVAPNRKCVINFCACHMFQCTAQYCTFQIILYETTNVAEVHIAHKTVCGGWNSGAGIEGVQDATASVGTVAPGRNYPGTWSVATPDARRFIPNATYTAYTCDTIPYNPIPDSIATIYWYTGTTYVGTGDSVNVNPTTPTTYEAFAVTCADTSKAYVTVTIGSGPTIRGFSQINPSICGASDGSITLHGIVPGMPDTITYYFDGVLQPELITTAAADSTITISGLSYGTYDSFVLVSGSCSPPPTGLINLTNPPPPNISNITVINPTVCGLNNGIITLYGIMPGQTDMVYCTIDGVLQPVITATAGADSMLTFTGLAVASGATSSTFTYYVMVGTCASNTVSIVLTNPPVTAAFTDAIHLGCNGDSVYCTNASLPAGYSSSWAFGDGATSTAADPLHIYADAATYTGTYVITLTYQTAANAACTSTTTQTVVFNHPFTASFTSNVSTMCLGVPVTFTNTSTGSSALSSFWDFGDAGTDVTTNPTHTYAAGGNYTTTLTITDNLGCTKSASENLNVVAIDVHTGVHDTTACLADSLLLHAYVSLTGTVDSVTYLWTPSNNLGEPTDSVTNFFGIGDFPYLVTVTAYPLLCTASDTETIHSDPPVTITGLTASQTIDFGSSIQLNADGASLFTWTPNNGTLDNANINDPIATPVDSITTYTVYAMNPYGCLDSASITITLAYSAPDFMPSGFSPNNDGLNDVFRIGNLRNGKLVDFRVFNRWGQLVFQTGNAEMGWDGTFNGVAQDIGTYNYMVIIAREDGMQKVYTGTVTLIR